MNIRLLDIIEYIVDNRGKNPPYYTDNGVPVIDTFLIGEQKYPNLLNVVRYIDNNLYENFIRCKIKRDDLLITLVGNGYGNVCLCNDNSIIIQNAIGIRFNKSINQIYMFYYFKQKQIKKWIQNLDRGSAQPNVKVGDLTRMNLSIPSLAVQNKTADILSNYDELIEKNNRKIAILEEQIQELYKEWFVRFRFPGYKKVKFKNGIPIDWEYKRLREIVQYYRGLSYSSEEIDTDSGVDLVNLNNIISYGGFNKNGTKKYAGKYKEAQTLKDCDLVMGVTDMTQERRLVGSVALVDTKGVKTAFSADLIKLISSVNKLFLYCMLKYGNYSKYIAEFANGANVLHLKPDSVMSVKVLMPSEELINKFAMSVENYFNNIKQIKELNDILLKQRDLLLPRLMSGKLKV